MGCSVARQLLYLLCAATFSRLALAQCDPSFRRGDANADTSVDLSDGIRTIDFLFTGGAELECKDAADANDSGDLDLSDAIFTFGYLFAGGLPPPLPGPDRCGTDGELDALACDLYDPCAADCGCSDGEVRDCGSSDLGSCRLGTQRCTDGRWGACEEAVEPERERCDGVDNDCDGFIDDGFERFGDPCDGADHDACASGKLVCRADGLGLECDEPGGSGFLELCDEVDNDCNGLTDEGFDLDSDGWKTCQGDCDDANAAVHPELAIDPVDGVDNDCDGETDEGPVTTSHARDLQPLWNVACSTPFCHDPVLPTGGLDLSEGNAYRNLVNVRSLEAVRLQRVMPSNPDRSYLWHKINATHLTVGGMGGSMPLGRPLLQPETRDLIRRWILEGAPE